MVSTSDSNEQHSWQCKLHAVGLTLILNQWQFSSKCEQCHIASWHRKLNTDLLWVWHTNKHSVWPLKSEDRNPQEQKPLQQEKSNEPITAALYYELLMSKALGYDMCLWGIIQFYLSLTCLSTSGRTIPTMLPDGRASLPLNQYSFSVSLEVAGWAVLKPRLH